jgi:molecular chaperone GrpE (heat shock protein)
MHIFLLHNFITLQKKKLHSITQFKKIKFRVKKLASQFSSIESIDCKKMSSSAVNTTSKKVAKKSSAPAEVAVPAPATTTKTSKATKTEVAATVQAPVVPAVVPAQATNTTETASTETNQSTFADEMKALHDQLTMIRDAASNALSSLKRIAKRASQDVKEARKNKRRSTAEGEERKPSNFEIPVPISDELSLFLGGGKNNKMSRSEVTKGINRYLNTNKLREKHAIKPDAALCKLLGITSGTEITIFTLQTYLKPHYPKAVKPQ